MQGSVGYIIWTSCYLSVLIGLSAYGIHRYFIIYLFLKNRKRETIPLSHFEQLPKVTVQLPIFNEVYVVERLLKSVSELDYPRDLLQIQVLDDSTDDTQALTARCVDELQSLGHNVERIHRVDRTGLRPARSKRGSPPRKEILFAFWTRTSFRSPTCCKRRSISLPIRRSG